jgi:flagellar hook-associated protein 3
VRVSDGMLSGVVVGDINRSASAMLQAQEQLASGRRINQPSDDPAGSERAIQLQAAVDQVNQYLANVADGRNWLQATESALQSATDILQRARVIGVQASSSVMTQNDLQAAAQELDQLVGQLVAVGNSQVGDRYIFGGTQTKQAPFVPPPSAAPTSGQTPGGTQPAGTYYVAYTWVYANGESPVSPVVSQAVGTGNLLTVTVPAFPPGVVGANVYVGTAPDQLQLQGSVTSSAGTWTESATGLTAGGAPPTYTYVGNAGLQSREIGPGNLVPVNVVGRDALGSALTALAQLRTDVNAVAAGSKTPADVSQDLNQLDAALSDVQTYQTSVGATLQRFDLAQTQLQTMQTGLQQILSSVQDADVAKQIVDLQRSQQAFQLALAVGARLLGPTLADYLK